ncbi:uncharacterized protein M6B38_370010 [Iris pallida]|uniref:Uncharacterized protein n=1 Tax=Iris pallida TaxID=29817 RepID=A0AAX6GER9_IRIPA|nr:uncharacterized protein M6B38_370010 [Iris pallida]
MDTLTSRSPLKVWDNAAFVVEAPAAGAAAAENLPWLPLQPISLDDPGAKENRCPNPAEEPHAGLDSEIQELEREIARLSKKLHLLKIKKAGPAAPSPKPAAAPTATRGRVVPAKFMAAESPTPLRARQSPGSCRRRGMSLGPMEISRIASAGSIPFPASASAAKRIREPPTERKVLESPGSRGRGLSLGPTEISGSGAGRKPLPRKLGGIREEEQEGSAASSRRRGMSIGPAEIFSARSRFRQTSKIQEAIKGAKETRAGRSLSSSPKPRRAATSSRVSELRKGVSTVGAKKPVRREEGPTSNIKPKALFQEAKTTGKRPNAKVRIVASRYSLIGGGNEPDSKKRKWSLPEPSEEDRSGLAGGGGGGSGRSLSLGGSTARSLMNAEEERASSSPPWIMRMAATLPKIRTLRHGAIESPRDSGCAKRVAELVGRRSCFAADDGSGSSSCQSLNFDEEDQ